MGMRLRRFGALLVVSAVLLSGCSGSVEHWILNTRVRQGDVALENGNARDAELSYRLALRVAPDDERARAGYVEAAGELAQELYAKGEFDDALAIVNEALQYDPQSVRLQAIKSQVDEAKLKREIVISNYPTYHEAGTQIEKAYEQLADSDKAILKNLHRFGNTYDANALTAAIKQSYELQLEVTKNTNRLIDYRQLVESGVPATASGSAGAAAATSLLPLP